jgi:hypothetical protein
MKSSVYFFGYNINNYFHFIFDALPHLLYYRESGAEKILVFEKSPPRYFWEALSILGIDKKEVTLHSVDQKYKEIFIARPLSYGRTAGSRPSPDLYTFFEGMVKKICPQKPIKTNKIYVSRRSHLHKDTSNIGTDYTTRRKLINEDEVVSFVRKCGYEEIFTEKLKLPEVINIFLSAKDIVGPFGGGLTNCIFSQQQFNLKIIHHPTRWTGNPRFKHCFKKNCNLTNIYGSKLEEHGPIPRYTRILHKDRIGEVQDSNEDTALVQLQDKFSFSFSKETKPQITIRIKDIAILDRGINSPWHIDIERLKSFF